MASSKVKDVKYGPQAKDDVASGMENGLLIIDVLANDLGSNANELWSLNQIDHGAITQVGSHVQLYSGATVWFQNGKVTFDPGAAYDHLKEGAVATDSFSYSIRMPSGLLSYAYVTVTITGTNDAPVAVADIGATTENAALTVNVLVNDTDVDDGHVFTLLSASAPSGKGSASVVANQLKFNPGTDFDHLSLGATETVVVAYTMRDENGASASSTLTITITGTNDVAMINGTKTGSVTEDGTLTSGATLTVSDVDTGENVFVAQAATAGSYGSFGIDTTGNWTYSLNNSLPAVQALDTGATVTDSFVVASKDGTATETVTLTINGTNETLNLTGAITMTTAQHNGFTTITAPGGADQITLSDAANNVTGNAAIETYVLAANAGLNFTLGATGQNVTETGTANNLLVFSAGAYTGNITGFSGAQDIFVVANGTNLSGINGNNNTNGAATAGVRLDFYNTNTTVTLSQSQHEAFDVILHGVSVDTQAITIIGAGAVTALAGIEHYTISNAANTLTVNADQLGVNVTSVGATSDTVNIAGLTVTGTYALDGAGDTLVATTGANITGVNGGAATTAETLNLTGAITMTTAQHNGFTTITAPGGADQITLSDAANNVTGNAAIETYVLAANAGLNFTLGATGQNVTETGTANNLLVFSAGAYTGNITGFSGAQDIFVVANGTNLSGINGNNNTNGAATAGVRLDFYNTNTTVTLSQSQHEAFDVILHGVSVDTQAITIIGAGAVTALAGIEHYTISNAANTLTVNADQLGVNVTSVGATSDTVNIAGLTVTGTYALDGAGDTLVATTGANITGVNGGAATTAETLNLTGAITMTTAQHNGFTTITAPGGADQITLSDAANNVTGNAAIETYVLAANAGLNFTLGATGQNVTETGTANNLLVFSAGAYTGNITGFSGAQDIFVVANGTNLSGINGNNNTNGAATAGVRLDFYNTNTTVTLSQSQHEAFDVILHGVSVDTQAITIIGAGAVTALAGIEHYTISNAANTLTVNADQLGVNVTSVGATSDTVNIAGLTVTGTYALDGAGDTLVATTGANITGVNGGAATTAETLNLTGAITMTTAQHNGFTTITAPGGADQITLSDAANNVTGNAAIETYVLAANAGLNFTLGATGQNVTETGTANNLLVFSAGAYTGNITGFSGAQDIFVVANGTNLSGINGNNNTNGAATAGVRLDFYNTNTTVTLSQSQHEAFDVILHGVSVDTQAITIIGAGAVTALAGIEHYTISNAANTLTVNADQLGVNVTSVGATSDTVNIAGLTVTGTYALDGAGDTLVATTGANITGVNGGAATTAETLNLTGAITMTTAQHNGFTTITAPGGADQITLSDAANNVTGNAAIETYVLAANAGLNFTLGATGQNVTETGTANNLLVFSAGAYTGNITGFEVADRFNVVNGTDLSGVNGGAVLGGVLDFANTGGTLTLSGAQYTASASTGTTDTQTVNISTSGTYTANAGVENYVLQGAGTDTFTFNGTDAIRFTQSVNLGGGGQDTVFITNSSYEANTDSHVQVFNFTAGTVIGADILNIDIGATNFNGTFIEVSVGTNAAVVAATGDVIEINGAVPGNLTDVSNDGTVETDIANAIGTIASSDFLVITYSGSGDGALYHVNSTAEGTDLTTGNMTVEFLGAVLGVGINAFTSNNFA